MAQLSYGTWDTAQNRAAMIGDSDPSDSAERPEDLFSASAWIQRHAAAYETSTEWHEANLEAQWERNMRSFHSKHPSGSKYYSDEFKFRSKLFRPKTRGAIRRSEATVAKAFFMTDDVLSIEPANSDDPAQLASADVLKYLLNHRLDTNPINWFLTVVGAWQDTRTLGICCSKQYWDYRELQSTSYQPALDEFGQPLLDSDGTALYDEVVETELLADEPKCELIAPENIRFDPGANWMDPVNSSPYFFELIPMYVHEVRERMRMIDSKTGRPEWIPRTDEEISRARTQGYNSVRYARENYRQDPKENTSPLRDHDIVWVHECAFRLEGVDWHYFTLGSETMLSEPQPLRNYYRRGERPWKVGFSTLEAHRPIPSSQAELCQDLQQQTNELTNARIDNVRLALNPRVFVATGENVDMTALRRWTPAGPVMMKRPTGPEASVYIDRPPDATAGSFQEQDRLNVDFDEIAGSYSSGSVQSNRRLNETVGGLQQIQGEADDLTDYDVMVFRQTWAEPTLRQLVHLEQAFETDVALLAVAGKKTRALQRYGVNEVTDEMLSNEMTIRVNAGMLATNPKLKFEKLLAILKSLAELYGPDSARKLNRDEIAKEIFGIMGYRDGDRFLIVAEDDPRIQQLQQIIEMLSEELQKKTMDLKGQMAIERLRQKSALEKQSMSDQTDILIELLRLVGAKQLQQGEQVKAQSEAIMGAQEANRARSFQADQADRGRAFDAQQAERARAAEIARQRMNGAGQQA